jgi:hypothetical protein
MECVSWTYTRKVLVFYVGGKFERSPGVLVLYVGGGLSCVGSPGVFILCVGGELAGSPGVLVLVSGLLAMFQHRG